ncbi:helix-turn-helix domain-containing protein [Krasilnikovia sp. MM14-A1259]|uniref:helix-turn-helix domain-containing protein n=1 Tax=Krasilnikovia sp. MM14-A1259 TaxID=3373539 RepID=UPI00399C6CF7
MVGDDGWSCRVREPPGAGANHSINTAAAALGHHPQNLTLQIQRLEADLGTPLLIRGHHYQAITLTRRGQQLLNHLHRPDVRELLDHYAPPDAHQTRRPYKRRRPRQEGQ